MNQRLGVLLVVLLPAPALAEGSLSVQGSLGFAGNVTANDSEADLATTYGGGLYYDAAVHPNVSLGVGGRFLSWIGEDAGEDASRNSLVDLVFRPAVRLAVDSRLALHAAAAIGPTYSSIGDDEVPGADLDPALGYHLGASIGGRFALSPTGGLEIELGYAVHNADHEADTILGSIDLEGQVSQVLLSIGGYFSL